jgi:glycosyltransferase involved in cell wall biosynthesis
MKPVISIVSPIYNEAPILRKFIEQIIYEINILRVSYEIILVNDGSNDKTMDLMIKLAEENPRIIGINFSKNFGQHAAISAGLEKSSGIYTVVMDGDLQDDPGAIHSLLKRIELGFDIVFVARLKRKNSRIYKFLQFVFYFFLNKLSDLTFDSRVGNFSMISERVKDAYKDLNGSIKYYPAALNWLGFSSSTIEFEQRDRGIGSRSKYTFDKRIRLALEVIVSHSRKPLRLAVITGVVMASIGFILGFIVLWLYLENNLSQPGWASLFVAIISLSGIQLLTLGIFGLYLGEISKLAQSKPQYVILKN